MGYMCGLLPTYKSDAAPEGSVEEQAALAGAIPKLQIIVERQHFGLENVRLVNPPKIRWINLEDVDSFEASYGNPTN